MTLKKKVKSKLKLFLRRMGMLCRKPIEPSKRIRVSKTVYHDGTTIKHDRITEVPINKNSFESELHVYNEIKKSVKKNK
jgi:hypothetical protein